MTIRYSLFNRPGNLEEVTNLLKRKKAKSVEMNFGVGCIDLETQMNVPACDYVTQTPQGELKFQYIFLGKNNALQWFAGILPLIGDASLMNYEREDDAYKKLQEQQKELIESGIEVILSKN